jgi:hypothetical protein
MASKMPFPPKKGGKKPPFPQKKGAPAAPPAGKKPGLPTFKNGGMAKKGC